MLQAWTWNGLTGIFINIWKNRKSDRWIYYIQAIMLPVRNDLFTDEAINSKLAEYGYAVADVCTLDELQAIREKTSELLQGFQKPGEAFFNFGQLGDFAMRQRSYEMIEQHVLPLLRPLLNENALIYAGTHLVKPAGNNSGFEPHQDNTMVDETKFRSYIIWMPLENINMENGAVCVLPKSHRLANTYRAVSVPWIYRKAKDWITKHSEPVLLQAGQALVFDSELIHFSLPNLAAETRIAVNAMVMPRQSAIIKCIYKKSWLNNYVEIYEVGMDYYLNQQNENKPVSGYKKIATLPYRQKKISEHQLQEMLETL